MSSYKLRNKDYESICKVQLCNWNRKEQATPATTPKKKDLFGDIQILTTTHLVLQNIKNTEKAIKILKNGKKILKAPSQCWRHCICVMSNHVESCESNTRMLEVSIGR